MALHAVGKEEFYRRIHDIEKGDAEKQAEERMKMRDRQCFKAHKCKGLETEERDR